jgi:hypothetical protein
MLLKPDTTFTAIPPAPHKFTQSPADLEQLSNLQRHLYVYQRGAEVVSLTLSAVGNTRQQHHAASLIAAATWQARCVQQSVTCHRNYLCNVIACMQRHQFTASRALLLSSSRQQRAAADVQDLQAMGHMQFHLRSHLYITAAAATLYLMQLLQTLHLRQQPQGMLS